ncbi:MAG: hypothetical protein K2O39_01190, partial [Clostridiales bacterium]|nr:hypothetical protein [Clostridiales bacterium]
AMDEIISLVVANGIFAVLFCGLLVYELRDSRSREDNYEKIIHALNDRLGAVEDIKTAAEEIKSDVCEIKTDVKILRSAGERKKRVTASVSGGGQCGAPVA